MTTLSLRRRWCAWVVCRRRRGARTADIHGYQVPVGTLSYPRGFAKQYLNECGEYCWGQSELIRRAGRLVADAVTHREFHAGW